MIVPLNDLTRAARGQNKQLTALVSSVIQSGWFVHGPHHQAFEQTLAGYLGVEHVLGVASGTDALEIVFRALATSERHTIVTVANAGGYATCAALSAGLDVRYVDVNPRTHTLDPDRLEAELDGSVAAVVVTHLYGRLGDVDAVRRICQLRGIRVVEDCAQSIGARFGHRMGGSLADIATFSFYPTKNLGALGDGGAIATSDDQLADRVRSLRQYGWTKKYHSSILGGRNSRLDEIQAAVLGFRLLGVDEGNERRREIILRYAEAAPRSVRTLEAGGPHHAGHLAVVETGDAAALARHLGRHGIHTDVHYPIPDHMQPTSRNRSITLPVTDSLVGRVLSLPCFPELTDDEVGHVCVALSAYREGVA